MGETLEGREAPYPQALVTSCKGREGKRPEGPGVPRNPSPGDVRGDGEGGVAGAGLACFLKGCLDRIRWERAA